ncbi:hypothetical protein M3Y94_00736300 [Aphelenchoides besseyi]|nr:hypothetical protein M3Y94_00736300 [Aphelenchoides besseyi]KAI6231936.1 hypothetical protein M3Y95_00434200 [Aphelenchoides besseyi]
MQNFSDNPMAFQPIGCFAVDANGSDIIDLTVASADNNYTTIHKVVNTLVASFGLLFNFLLGFLIMTRSQHQLRLVRPILLLGCIVDILLSINYIVLPPIIFAGYGYYIGIVNELFQVGGSTTPDVWIALSGMITIGSFVVVPFQFLYRSYTLKFGEPPKGRVLWLYICGAMIGVGIAGWISCTLYFNRVPEFRPNALKILRSAGYLHIKEESLHGSHSNETKFYIFINCMGGFVYSCYAIVIYTQLAMRKHFRNLSQHMSATTKRMHQDLTRALIALAVFPFITYIVAGSCAMYSVAQCRDMGLANCLCSILYTLSPMVNAISTVILIRPFRLTILEWMGCKESGSGNKTIQTTGQSLSVSFNSQSAVATISSHVPLAPSDS